MSVTVDSSEIISQEIVRDNKKRLIFIHNVSDKTVLGPFVEHRNGDDDEQAIQDFLASSRASYEQSLNQPPPDPEEEFLEMILQQGDDEFLKKALEIDTTKLLSIKSKLDQLKGVDEMATNILSEENT